MKLSKLLERIENYEIYGKEVTITNITDNSQKVKKGSLFIAIKGLTVDGHKYIKQAIKKRARAIIGEMEFNKEWGENITYVKVSDSRKALGIAASAFYGYPSEKLKVIGVTGTDGKTTTTTMLHHILEKQGYKVGSISTVSAKIGREIYETGLHTTTPGPLALNFLLKEMVKKNYEIAILEVTSHGLDQKRVEGIKFYGAILTNITKEHLDYHKNFKNYVNTKLKLFKRKELKLVVLNKDDRNFNLVKSQIKQDVKLYTYSLKDSKSDFFAKLLSTKDLIIEFEIKHLGKKYKAKSPIFGEYNIANVLASTAVAHHLKVNKKTLKKATETFRLPKGRAEEIKNDKGFRIFIDFAHTPSSLKKLLISAKKLLKKDSRLICIFGCAGERDTTKRIYMPKIATKYAQVSIFTAEDPRREKVSDILSVMENAVLKSNVKKINLKNLGKKNNKQKGNVFLTIEDRGKAIFYAINRIAKKGDVIFVLGKGHERSMNYNGIEYYWSDKEAVLEALRKKIFKLSHVQKI